MMPGKVKLQAKEIRSIRENLELSREEIANLLGLSGIQAYKNIETGARNPGKLAAKLLRYLNSLPKSKAKAFIDELNNYSID